MKPSMNCPDGARRNIILLSAAAMVSNGFLLWALMKAKYVDSFFPQDSRVEVALGMCWVAFPMGLIFCWRACRIARRCGPQSGVAARFALGLAMVSLIVPIAYSFWTGFGLFLVLGALVLVMFPPLALGIVAALFSTSKDSPLTPSGVGPVPETTRPDSEGPTDDTSSDGNDPAQQPCG